MARNNRDNSKMDKELQDLKNSIGTLDMSTKDLYDSLYDLKNTIEKQLVPSISQLGKNLNTNTTETRKGNKPAKGGAGKGGKQPAGNPIVEDYLNKNKSAIGNRSDATSSAKNLIDKIAPSLSQNLSKMFGDKKMNQALGNFSDKMSGVGGDKFKDYKDLRAKGVGAQDAMKATGMNPKQVKGMMKAAGGPGFGANMLGKAGNILGKAGGGMMGAAGGLLKAAGPIGAAFSIGMEVVDFFDSGKAAQMASDISTFFGGAGAGKEATEAAFKSSKKYREIVADFNIMEPIREEFAERRDMMDWQKSAETDALHYKQSLVSDEFNYRRGIQKENIEFEYNAAKQRIDFEYNAGKQRLGFQHDQETKNIDAANARRKALFTSGMSAFGKYIGISERALEAIGSSTEAVLSTVATATAMFGASAGDLVAMSTAAQGVSKLLGSSAEEVMSMANTFRLMNKSSLKVGTNLVTGIKEFAEKNGVVASIVMKDMMEAQGSIYKFSSGTAENFAKQAVSLAKMGTSMTSMMKASDTMVLNYKDSIKSEMGLSAMLGKNVDLSEARAKLMAGDQAGGAEAIKSALGDVDIESMNPFAKQQLSQATGMDIQELMSLTQGGEGEVGGTLDQKNAEKTGSDIANGALKMEVKNEKAAMERQIAHDRAMMELDIAHNRDMMKMDQAHAHEMLKFEQDTRKAMLFMEQQQRLENLAIEAKWRLKYATLDTEEKIASAVGEMQVESASKWYNNVFQDAAKTFKDNVSENAGKNLGLVGAEKEKYVANQMQLYNENASKAQSYALDLVNKGVLTSENAQETMVGIMSKIANNEQLTVEGVQSMLKTDDAFKKAEEQKKAAVEEARKKVEEAKKREAAGPSAGGNALRTAGNWVLHGLGSFMGQDSTGEKEAKAARDKNVADLNAAQAQLKAAEASLAQVKTATPASTTGTTDMASWFGSNSVMTPTAFAPAATDATYVGTSNALQNYNEPGILQVRDNNAQFVIDGITAALQSTFGSIGSSGDVYQRQAGYLQQIVARTEGGAAAAMANLDTNTKTLTNQTIQTKQADLRGIVHQKSFEYQAKIQNELVAQMATANVILDAILESTEAGKNINLSGRKVNSTLLQQNRTNYAVAKTPLT